MPTPFVPMQPTLEPSGFQAYLNGEFIPVEELRLSAFDQGIVHGVAITEMLRTFSGQPFQLQAHLNRFEHSAQLCGIPLRIPRAEIADMLLQLIAQNALLVNSPQELGVILSATPGLNPTYTGRPPTEPTLYAHTFLLPGELWAEATLTGQHLAVSLVPQVPDECIPVTAKTRSRLAWYLADRDVQQRYPGARAVLLDLHGYVRETSTANLFVVRSGRLLTPPATDVLPGIGRAVTLELAHQLGLDAHEIPLTMDDFLQAEEIFTTSTPYCLLGVSRLNSTAAGLQFPGPITSQLLNAWNELVGHDIHAQLRAMAHARRAKDSSVSGPFG